MEAVLYEVHNRTWPLINDAFCIQKRYFVVECGGMKIGELYHDHQKIETKMYENIHKHYQIEKYKVKHLIESLFP